MAEARGEQGNVIPGQALDVGHARSVGSGILNRRLQSVLGGWERPVDGVEGDKVRWYRHTRRLTVRRDDIDGLQ
jgi:hypothetical protein